jgi:external thioesterase TEII
MSTQKPKLFILHHAGGNVYSYQFLLPHLSDVFDVEMLELPGRGRRMKERLVYTFDAAVADYVQQIESIAGETPFMIYGHSMGALLSPTIIRELHTRGLAPFALLATGSQGRLMPEDPQKYNLSKEDLVADLRRMGGVPETFLENKALFDFFEPIMRADFELLDLHDWEADIPVVETPIYAVMGDAEKYAGAINTWQRYTTGEFRSEIVPGGHFFIFDIPVKLADIIKECYDRYMVHKVG